MLATDPGSGFESGHRPSIEIFLSLLERSAVLVNLEEKVFGLTHGDLIRKGIKAFAESFALDKLRHLDVAFIAQKLSHFIFAKFAQFQFLLSPLDLRQT